MNQKYRKAVFIAVYRKEGDEIFYLLLHRKHHWIGWEFPKGGVESGESLFKTAKREAREETGQSIFNVKKYNVSGKYRYHKKFADRAGFIGQTYVLFSGQVKNKKVKLDKKEHSGYEWLEFDKAIKKLTHKNQKKCLRIVNRSLK